ncbi:hypothetical protein K1T71_012124 [Dendrolimus kikuchii]|uniref:Uncharacterized protein n=1 Tax=Dendrolimus kikuchii TaxID=765133 RepID=A0ACC1CKR7_9NEOP|nr:hypothetical protein K1T71_012124 [Dendrolimus kikuchii]
MTLSIIFCVFLVLSSGIEANEHLSLLKHKSVNKTLGPDDATYCQLIDPKGNIAYDGFGRCNLVIERVSMDHRGRWTMAVGLPERIRLLEMDLNINIIEEEYKPVVNTSVAREAPEVIISCTVSSLSPITACKFRDPSGKVLIAAPGISEDRFVYHGYTDDGLYPPYTNQCGFRITDPITSDLGLWRCAMESADGIYYGFLSVLCPVRLQDPEVLAMVTTVPTLTAERTAISVQEGDSVTMSCYIQAPIRYCYFRRQNGTIFNVSPGMSTPTMEYVGAGFESGECGVRFHNLLPTDAGTWNCAVGLHNDTAVEQRVSFTVAINPLMTVRHYDAQPSDALILDAVVTAEGRLDYCRFIRMDGFGFTSRNVPEGYGFLGSPDAKICSLIIYERTIINLHPWTVAAKIIGRDDEIVRTTTDNLLWFPPSDDVNSGYYSGWYLWLLIALMVVAFVLVIAACGPKKNRKWTFARAAVLRNSLRNSLRKEPLPPQAPFTPNDAAQNQQQNV